MCRLKELNLVYQNKISIGDIYSSWNFLNVKKNIDIFKQSLSVEQIYINIVTLLCNFISAERTGNWWLHLDCVQQMPPYRAAAGHNHY